MLIYLYFEGYNYTTEESVYARVSFGNMGYSGNSCRRNFINWDTKTTRIDLQCQGSTRIRKVISTGIVDVNQNGEENTLSEFNRCFYDTPIDYDSIPIMENFDTAAVEA